MRRALALVALLSSGCGVSYASEYDLFIDQGFAPEQQEQIIEASARWTSATDGDVKFNVHIGGIDTPTTKHQIFVITLANESTEAYCHDRAALGCTENGKGLDVAFVRLQTSLPAAIDDGPEAPNDLAIQVATHELGHAMGLSHDANGTVMAPYVTQGSVIITARDIAQFRAVRGL